MKKVILLSLLAWGVPGFSKIINGTIAVVGNEIILQSEVDEILRRNKSTNSTSDEVLKELIEKRLLESECKKLGFYPSSAEVKQAINDIKKQNRLDDQGLRIALQNMGLTFSAYETQLYFEICKTRIIQNKIRSRVNITKEDLHRAFVQHYGSDAEIKLRLRDMIVAPSSNNSDDLALAKQLAITIVQSLRAGQKWEWVLEKAQKTNPEVHSEILGILSKSDLVAPIAESVFSDSTEKFKGPVETEEGFHVIEVLEKVREQKIPLVDVEKDLHKQLFEKEVERLLKQYIEEVRSSTYVDVHKLLNESQVPSRQ